MIEAIIDVDDAIEDLVDCDELTPQGRRLLVDVLPGAGSRDIEDLDEYEKNVLDRACAKLSDHLAQNGYGVDEA